MNPQAMEELRRRAATANHPEPSPQQGAKAPGPTPPAFVEAMMDASQLRALTIEQRPKLLGEWMREGDLGYLFAPRGAGKSWLAMLMADSVANGFPLGAWTAGGGQHDVFYLDAEMNLPDLQERLTKLEITTSSLHILSNELGFHHGLPSFNIASPLHQEALSALLPDRSLFIIDNLSTSQIGMDENANNDFDALRDWLMSLRHRGITVLIVHHAGRNGAMRGASRREDMAHWIIKLEDATSDNDGAKSFITSFAKCRNCRPGEAPPLKWTLSDFGDSMKITCAPHNGPDAMLEHIQDGMASATELAEELKVSKGTISKWAKRLIADGRIKKDRRDYLPA
jgi:RecA-family ATPase